MMMSLSTFLDLQNSSYPTQLHSLYLWDCRKNQALPDIAGFKFKVRINHQVEKYISTKNNKLETFYEKWPKDISPLLTKCVCN